MHTVYIINGFVAIYATKWIINASYNQHQQFLHLSPDSWITDVVNPVGEVRAPNADRCSRVPNIYWPHTYFRIIQAIKIFVDCNERLHVRCVDYPLH
jgi:hypothetical protein